MQTSGSTAIKKLIELTKAAVSEALAEAKTYTDSTTSGGVDHIIEQGTTGKWTWRKWASGVAEMWAVFDTDTLAIDEAWGSLYFGTWMRSDINVAARKYPFAFADTPTISATYMSGGADAWLISLFHATDDLKTGAPAYALARPNQGTIHYPRIGYYVVGRYKA